MIVNDKGAFDIRQAVKGDKEYILRTWLLTYKQSGEMKQPGLIDKDYFYYEHKRLEELISRSSEKGSLYVCHHANAPESIRGFLCGEAFYQFPVIHWLQVKKADRQQGVASALIEQFFMDFDIKDSNTLYTFSSQDLMFNKELRGKALDRLNLVYHPWMKNTTMPAGWEATPGR